MQNTLSALMIQKQNVSATQILLQTNSVFTTVIARERVEKGGFKSSLQDSDTVKAGARVATRNG